MKTCLFDIDGTLIVTDRAGKDAMADAFLSVAGFSEMEVSFTVSGKTDRGIFEELYQLHNKQWNQGDWDRFVDLYIAGLERNLPLRDGRVLPGVLTILATLTDNPDVQMGLLTGNVREGAMIKLTHYELLQHFHFGGYGDDHAQRNDVAKMAFDAANHYASEPIDPADVVVIGDTPNDVVCAHSIGAKAIAVATGIYSVEQLAAASPELVVSDLSDTDPILQFILN